MARYKEYRPSIRGRGGIEYMPVPPAGPNDIATRVSGDLPTPPPPYITESAVAAPQPAAPRIPFGVTGPPDPTVQGGFGGYGGFTSTPTYTPPPPSQQPMVPMAGGGGMPSPYTISPQQNYLRLQQALSDVRARKPTARPITEFNERIPLPQELPAVQSPDTQPLLNNLLKYYPLAALLGGYRVANTALPAAAEGGQQYLQGEYQSQVAERAQRQQMLDATYAARVRDIEDRAENARYQNQSTISQNQSDIAGWKGDLDAAESALQRGTSELRSQRSAVTNRIAANQRYIVSGNIPPEEINRARAQIETDRKFLAEQLGGPETPDEVQPLDPISQQFFNRSVNEAEKRTAAQTRAETIAGASTANTTARIRSSELMHGEEIKLRRWIEENRKTKEKNDTSLGWAKLRHQEWMDKNKLSGDYDKKMQEIVKYNVGKGNDALVQNYKSAKDAYDTLLKRKASEEKVVSDFAKRRADNPRIDPGVAEQAQAQSAQDFLDRFDSLIRESERRLNDARDGLRRPIPLRPVTPTNRYTAPQGGGGGAAPKGKTMMINGKRVYVTP